MNFISLTRFFSTIILFALVGLQGCYEQTMPGADASLTDPDEDVSIPSGHAGSYSRGSVRISRPGADASLTDPDKKVSTPRGHAATYTRDTVEISLHPMSQTVNAAQSFTLNVSATGNKVLRYQWRKNGKVIRNAVRADYMVRNASVADEGSYEVIVISGKRMVMSRIARITIGNDRSASLSWAPPAKRADGSPLSEEEIAAYRIYHSNDDGSIGRDYEVDPSQQRFELDDLPRGAHHFAIATVDINGMESTLSAVVTKRIL